MSSASSTFVPRLVRLLSNVHAVKKEGAGAFSRQHFPKTLAALCASSFGIGFYGMHRMQQNRQLEWERRQEEAEAQFYKVHGAKKVSNLPRKLSVGTTSI